METGFVVSIIEGCLIIVLCIIIIVLFIKFRKKEKTNDIKIKVNGGKEVTENHSNTNDLIMDFVSIEDEIEHTVCFLSESGNEKSRENTSVLSTNMAVEDDDSIISMDEFSDRRIRLTDINSNRIFETQISDEIIIGRINQEGKSNFIQIDYDRSISRIHCKIERRKNCYYLSDLGSSNHVFVNNSVLNGTVEMFNGQVFTLGKVKLRFEVL